MAHVNRYRSGRVSEVRGSIHAGDVVEIGDLVALSSGYFKDYDLLAQSTEVFHDTFVGVLVEGGTNGQETTDTPALVYTDGEFEYPLSVAANAAHPIGDLVGAAGAQIVDFVNAGNFQEAIGRLARPCLVGDTTVLVRIMSVAMAPVALSPA